MILKPLILMELEGFKTLFRIALSSSIALQFQGVFLKKQLHIFLRFFFLKNSLPNIVCLKVRSIYFISDILHLIYQCLMVHFECPKLLKKQVVNKSVCQLCLFLILLSWRNKFVLKTIVICRKQSKGTLTYVKRLCQKY